MCLKGTPLKECGGRRESMECVQCHRDVTVSHGSQAAPVDKNNYVCIMCKDKPWLN